MSKWSHIENIAIYTAIAVVMVTTRCWPILILVAFINFPSKN